MLPSNGDFLQTHEVSGVLHTTAPSVTGSISANQG